MKTMLIILVLSTVTVGLFEGCKKDETTTAPEPEIGNPFEIHAWNYATNHFFVDTLYRQYYEPYYQNDPPMVNPSTQVVEEQLWIQRSGPFPDPSERSGIAYTNLPTRLPQGYDSTFREPVSIIPGEIELGRFVLMNRSQYEMTADGYLGVVTLKTPVPDQLIIAISYRRADGTQFGEFTHDLNDTTPTPIILKMIKPMNLNSMGSNYNVAWNQLLKNIYSIGVQNTMSHGFILDVMRRVPGQEDQNFIPPTQRLLRVFGLDRFSADGTPAASGDGLFDFRLGRTVDQARGEIIFPSLRPFDQGIMKYYQAGGITLPESEYYYSEVYDTTKTFSQQALLHNRYIIRGRASSDN